MINSKDKIRIEKQGNVAVHTNLKSRKSQKAKTNRKAEPVVVNLDGT